MKTIVRFLILLLTILISGALTGCGGSGTSGSGVVDNPIVSIDWPSRSRGIGAPSSALSAQIALKDRTGVLADNKLFVLRYPNATAHTGTYTLPGKSIEGLYDLTITFYAGTTNTTQAVGLVDVPVRVTATGLTNLNGSPLQTVTFEHLIESVTVSPNQSIGVSELRQLTATARDKFSNLVVVSPGSIRYILRSGMQFLSLPADGMATGLKVGTASIYATVDNVQSPDVNIEVTEVVQSIVDVASNDLAFDASSGLIWSTVGNTGKHANSIVGINPETGLISRIIPLGITPNQIEVTENGQYAYVNIPADGTTRRIDLATGVMTLSIPTGTATSMCIVPGSPNSIVIGFNPIGGVNISVWDDTVRRANSGAGGDFIHMASPTVMYGNGGSSLFTNVLVPGAINWTGQIENLITNDFIIHNGLLIDTDGHVVNPTTMTLVGQMPNSHLLGDGRHIASSASDDRAYVVTWNSSTNKQILVYDLSTYEELPQRDTGLIPGGAADIVACGNHTVAFRNFGAISSPNKVFIFRGLP